jgi:hypothetical protein
MRGNTKGPFCKPELFTAWVEQVVLDGYGKGRRFDTWPAAPRLAGTWFPWHPDCGLGHLPHVMGCRAHLWPCAGGYSVGCRVHASPLGPAAAGATAAGHGGGAPPVGAPRGRAQMGPICQGFQPIGCSSISPAAATTAGEERGCKVHNQGKMQICRQWLTTTPMTFIPHKGAAQLQCHRQVTTWRTAAPGSRHTHHCAVRRTAGRLGVAAWAVGGRAGSCGTGTAAPPPPVVAER